MKSKRLKRIDRYSVRAARRGGRHHRLRRLALSEVARDLREAQSGHIIHRDPPEDE